MLLVPYVGILGYLVGRVYYISIEIEIIYLLVYFLSLHPHFTSLFYSSWTKKDPGRDRLMLDPISNSRWLNNIFHHRYGVSQYPLSWLYFVSFLWDSGPWSLNVRLQDTLCGSKWPDNTETSYKMQKYKSHPLTLHAVPSTKQDINIFS